MEAANSEPHLIAWTLSEAENPLDCYTIWFTTGILTRTYAFIIFLLYMALMKLGSNKRISMLQSYEHIVLTCLFVSCTCLDFKLNEICLWYKYDYTWADGVQIKKPIEVSAPKYVEYLTDWIETQIDDESIFPQRLGSFASYIATYCTI